ncbi:GGDEF domain-containing protein [Thermomonas sp.]|uniref:GGDEF domain-containing protein n=1 Tax=Thermomonas sp. TaxID=1971895 RepID=UPI002D1FAA57|nr:GGDEF domain-containing protein [Thermomonas sp.]
MSLMVALLGGHELWLHATEPTHAQSHWLDVSFPDYAGRPSAHMTGLATLSYLLLAGVGLLVVAKRALWLREAAALAVIASVLASAATYGQVLAGDGLALLEKLPILTAAMQLLLVLGWLSSVPTTGMTRVAVADSLGGAFARRLILPSLLLPSLMTFALRAGREWLGMSESLSLALASVVAGGAVATMIVWVGFLLDRVERQRRVEILLRQDAHSDGLTGLANRRAFDAALSNSKRRPGEFSLLMLDLDRFKDFNDSFGHQAGDDVLREAGRILRTVMRSQDMAARYGGEEFVILLPEGGERQAQLAGQRILDAFRGHAWPQRAMTVSIGAAVAREGEPPEDLLRRADAALYGSKASGRDRLTVDST